MSFVLVLAAAVTLVVGLLQSGLTLIYLSIGCSVLAGVVLAIAVLRGRPEPRPAAVGRAFTPPAPAAQVPASVGATTSGAEAATTWSEPYPSASPAPTPPPPPPPPPPPTRSPAAPSDEAATKAAGTALLGRLRGRKVGDATPQPEAPPFTAADVAAPSETAEMPLVSVPEEDEDEFPIAGYEQMRATDLLRQLGALDRNQLEAVRDREASGRNRFTVMNRIDTLLAAKAEPAWEVADDEWEAEVVETSVIEVGPADVELDEDEEEAFAVIAVGEVEDDEVDELVAPVDDFPIAGYEALTVGQILPRLSELDADQLAQVRAREQQGRGRGTILDRVDRLAAKTASGALAMPAAAPARRLPARKAPAAKAPAPRKARAPRAPEPPAPPPAPMKEAVKRARAAKAAPPPPPPAAPAKRAAKAVAPAKKAPAARRAPARKATAAPTASPMKEAVKKARARKTT